MTDFNREIRDAAIVLLEGLGRYAPPGRPGAKARIRRTPLMPPQANEVPCLLVYLTGQRMTPDGDANHGEPRFVHEAVLNVSGVLRADTAADLDDKTSAASAEILETLLEAPEWLALIEGVTDVTQRIRFDDQAYLAAIVETSFTVTYRSSWPPRVADTFGSVSLRTPGDRLGSDYDLPT